MSVPGADFLADVTAKDPVAEAAPQLDGNRPTVLDGQRTEAAVGVKQPRLGQRVRWTGIEAGGATATVVHLDRLVGRQVERGQQPREEKIAASPRVNQHRVLAKPAKASPGGELPFRQRCRIDHPPAAATRHLPLQPRPKLIEPLP